MSNQDKSNKGETTSNQETGTELGFFDRHELLANGLSTAGGVAAGALFVAGAKVAVDKITGGAKKKAEQGAAALLGGMTGFDLFK